MGRNGLHAKCLLRTNLAAPDIAPAPAGALTKPVESGPVDGHCGGKQRLAAHGPVAMTDAVLLSTVILLGIAPITGSFLGVLALRIPAGRTVLIDRSACDACGHVLGLLDLMPVVNWMVSRGRCRYCGERVSLFYPLIELAALAVVLWAWTVASGPELWAGSILGWLLMVLALINTRHFTLPNELVLPLIAFGFAAAAITDTGAMVDSLIGTGIGFGCGLAMSAADAKLDRRAGLGSGEARLLAAAGAWVGWQGLPDVAVVALLAALAVAIVHARARSADRRLPVGACVCLATWLAWLYGPLILG